jgi:hypothetical protein
MLNNNNNYGILLDEQNIKLHRVYFEEMCNLIGIKVLYYAPRADKHWTTYAEIKSNYYDPILVGCIFEDHPNQYTMKKLGWDSELQENASLISVPYDLEKLQVGSIFIVPSGIDNSKGRVFRVVSMRNSMIYPSSITCELVPEYENTFSSDQYDFKNSSFNLLNDESEDYE